PIGSAGQLLAVVAGQPAWETVTYVTVGADQSGAAAAALSAAESYALSLFNGITLPTTAAATTHKWLNSYTSTTGAFTETQPAAADLSDTATAGNVLRGNGTSFVSAVLSVGDLSSGALASGTTATTNPNAADASAYVATDQFVQNVVELSMATTPLNLGGLGPATYSLSSRGTGSKVNYTASAGAITSITIWIPFVGSGYAAGDIVTVGNGNYDAMILVTAVASGVPSSGTILYGGTGYTSGTSTAITPNYSVPFTFLLSGAISGNITLLMTAGTYLTQSNQWIFCNNTTGAYTITVGVSNSTNTGASGGRTVTIPQGTNNSSSVLIQTDE